MRYTVVVIPDAEDGGFFAYVPTIPNCFTHADTLDDAMSMVQDAASALLASMASHGEEVPIEAPGAMIASIEVEIPALTPA